MSLIRYRSPSVLDDFRKEMNQLFNSDSRDFQGNELSALSDSEFLPAVDIKEDNENYVFFVDVPGVSNKDISVIVDDNHRLVIEGRRDSESKEEKENYIRIERNSGSFYRSFALPDNIDAENIKAKSTDGLLNIIIPKSSKKLSRKIEVGN